jgi:hypothetical protein
MDGTCKRRILRRVALTIATVALLPLWYVAAWLTVSRAEHDRLISFSTAQRVRPAFVPLLRYCESELPGSRLLGRTWWYVNPPVIEKLVVSTPMGVEAIGTIWIESSLQAPRPPEVDLAIKAEFATR